MVPRLLLHLLLTLLPVNICFSLELSSEDTNMCRLEPLVRSTGYSVNQFAQALVIKPKSPSQADMLLTSLGPIELSLEPGTARLLGFNPADSVIKSWEASQAFLTQSGLPNHFIKANLAWNVVFTKATYLKVEGSRVSSEYCHTALMGPPADILIDTFRLLNPCEPGKKREAPAKRLSHSLVHEVGHGVEYQLMGQGFSRRQRWHSEGFASWFEANAVSYLSRETNGGKKNEKKEVMLKKASLSYVSSWRPYLFRGSPQDYLISFALISALVEEVGTSGLQRVYQKMSDRVITFDEAVHIELGWDFATWMGKTHSFLLSHTS